MSLPTVNNCLIFGAFIDCSILSYENGSFKGIFFCSYPLGCKVIDGDILNYSSRNYLDILLARVFKRQNFKIVLKLVIIEVVGMVGQFLP
jgi:hypothetical protein